MKRRGGYVMDDLNLIGVEYLWRVSHNVELFPSCRLDRMFLVMFWRSYFVPQCSQYFAFDCNVVFFSI